MPATLTLGPFAIATTRLVAIGLLLVFLWLAGFLGRRRVAPYAKAAQWAVIGGLLAARLWFVVQHFDAYRGHPFDILAFWQGGFSLWAGMAAAIAILFLVLRGVPAVGMAGVVAGMGGLMLFTQHLVRPEPIPFPRELVLARLNGTPLPFAALEGRPFAVNLWASWCLPCRREMPMLVEVGKHSPVPLYLVNSGEEPATIRAFLQKDKRLSGASVLSDRGQRLAAVAGTGALPTTLFFTASGVLQESHVGEISRAGLLARLGEIGGAP